MSGPNAIGALRLAAAGMVVLGHSFVITGRVPPVWFGVPVHVLGVHVFFTLSGYLVTGSWRRDPSVLRYAWRRALRIMPGLLAVVAVTVAVAGPVLTRLDLVAYAGSVETRLYLWNALLAPYYVLPGVFQDGRPFTAVNGSLWSLPIEVAMYGLAPLLAGGGRAVRRVVLPVAAVAACVAAYVFTVVRPDQVEPVIWWNSVPFGLRFAGDFVLGALVQSWRVERWLRPLPAVGLLAGLALLPLPPWLLAVGVQAALPYAVLAFGLLPVAGPRTDLSYGLYLWGCPVQQAVLTLLGAGAGPWGLTAVALPLALGLAWASWHGVERPCLRFKPVAIRAVGADAMLA